MKYTDNRRIFPRAALALLLTTILMVTISNAQGYGESQLIGKKAAYFSLKNLEGKDVRITDFVGKVVILDFWATWCPPCRRGVPDFIQLQNEFGKKQFTMLGVSLDQDGPGVVKKFVSTQGVNYPMVMGDEGVVRNYGNIEAIPTTFIIDKKGVIRNQLVGYHPMETFRNEVKKLLAE